MERKQSSSKSKVPWVRGNCIGKGSFGAVHLASSFSDGSVFAVKSAAVGSTQTESLEMEIQVLSSLSSPYVVKYLGDDVSVESGVRYRNLHVEYLPGGTAADILPGTSESDVRSITRCVVSALGYVHSRGIVHCDVKGRNILLGSSAKLADFGSAIREWDTGMKIGGGSPLWIAPEVVRREYQGPESDVWSLGCTVIEMVTGKPAWEDRGLETLTRIGYSDHLPRFPAGLSELGLDFLDRCLQRDPALRWTCDQLLLHPFLSSVSPTLDANNELSPRCVLDWFGSGSGSEEEEEEAVETAKQRIGKLAGAAGVNWESEDGWEWVRRESPQLQQMPPDDDAVSTVFEASSCSDDSAWILLKDGNHQIERAVSGACHSRRLRGGSGWFAGGVHVGDLLAGPLCRLYGPLEEAEAIWRVGSVGLGLVVLGPFCNLSQLFFCIRICSCSYLLAVTVMMMMILNSQEMFLFPLFFFFTFLCVFFFSWHFIGLVHVTVSGSTIFSAATCSNLTNDSLMPLFVTLGI